MTVQAIKLAPSILAADFAGLGDRAAEAEKAGARPHSRGGHERPFWNISMGTPFSGSLRWVARLPLEAHLMIADPDFRVAERAHVRIDSLPVGGSNDLSRIIGRSKALAKQVGVAVDPATSATLLEEIMGERDQAVVVTFGFAHQQFLHPTPPKSRRAPHATDQMRLSRALEVERWDHMTTAPLAVAAGSRRAGSGVGIFKGDKGIAAAMQGLRTAATRE